MNLIDIKNGEWVRIVSFKGGRGIQRKLMQMGFIPGTHARVIRCAPFHGPLLIQIDGREVVIGRKIAHQILVEYV